MHSTTLSARARRTLIACLTFTTLGCGGTPKPATPPAPAPTGVRGTTAQQLAARDLLRVDAQAGGGVDILGSRKDSTIALTLRVAGDSAPRVATRLRVTADDGRRLADSLGRFVNRALGAGEEARLRIAGMGSDPALELVRMEAGEATTVRLTSTADGAVVTLRPDEVRGVARMLRSSAIMVAPVSPEETSDIRIFFEFEVQKPVVPAPRSCFPLYPAELRMNGITGSVQAQFIVSAEGRVEMETFRAIRSDHVQFTEAVRTALRCMRFVPAELHGRTVRQLVQQPFTFDISR